MIGLKHTTVFCDEICDSDRVTRKTFAFVLGAVGLATLAATAGFVIAMRRPPEPDPRLRETPGVNVLSRITALSRMETVSFHMERVLELTDEQSRFFGLVEAQDKILLVVAAEVTAGIDLSRLNPSDIVVDVTQNVVRIRLPDAEIFHVQIDEAHTHVHARNTELLANRREDLESQARQRASTTLRQAALEAGILRAAQTQAKATLTQLLLGLGFTRVEFESARSLG